MTPERMAELRELCRKATPGPWGGAVECDESTSENSGCTIVVESDSADKHLAFMWDDSEDDYKFVAAARTALPELLDEIERLQERERSAIEGRDAVIRDAVRMQMKRDEYAERLALICLEITAGLVASGESQNCESIIAAAKAKLAGENNV